MDIAKRYFRYHFKDTLLRFILLISLTALLTSRMCATSYNFYWLDEDQVQYSASLEALTVVIYLSCVIVTALEFAPFNNRRNLDLWFSSPLSREKIAVVNMINGAIHIAAALLVNVVVAAVVMWSYNISGAGFRIGYVIPYFFVTLGFSLLFLGITTMLFVMANNTFDGTVFVLLYWISPYVVTATYSSIFTKVYYFMHGTTYYFEDVPDAVANFSLASPIDPAFKFASILSALCDRSYSSRYDSITAEVVIWTVIWVILQLAAIYLAVIFFRRRKTEKIGGVSDIKGGYPVLIPLVGYCCIIGFSGITALFCAGLMVVGYVIFRRGFKFKKPDVICMIIGGVLAVTETVLAIIQFKDMFYL